MFKSDDFPLGPNGQFPKQRIATYGNPLIPPVSMQDTYLSGNNTVSRMPSIEKDFTSSNRKVKDRMKYGMAMRRGGVPTVDLFRPRYAPKSRLKRTGLGQEEHAEFEEQYGSMDMDPTFDFFGERMDEGETDDSVGRVVNGRMMSGRMIGSKEIRPATMRRPVSRSVVGSGGWLKGIQKLLGYPQG